MSAPGTRFGSNAGFWIFLYSVATLSVFFAIFLSQTEWGRTFLVAAGSGGAVLLDAAWRGVDVVLARLLERLPAEYRPGSGG